MHEQDRQTQNRPTTLPMLRERDLAVRWNLSQRTLQRWRAENYGPPYHVIGGAIRYSLAEVMAFEDTAKRGGLDQ